MKKIILTILLIAVVFSINAQNYQYATNLKDVNNDKLKVTLVCPKITSNEIIYYFPKTIPGTYAILDYGNYISKFIAYDENGKKLKIKKIDDNSFKIFKANTLKKIEYIVDDTFDEKVKKSKKIFEPAGTGFKKGEYFLINSSGVFGCFEDMEKTPFMINFTKEKKLEGFSSLVKQESENQTQFEAKDYYELIDNPILFTSQKPEYIKVGNCKITIASYSVTDSTSYKIKKEIEPLFKAIQKFTGKTPVEEYKIIVFIDDLRELSDILSAAENNEDIGLFTALKMTLKMKHKLKGKAWGALEHGKSSVYFFPYVNKHSNYLDPIKDGVIHEFMHIYTPLNLHSDLIENFNYRTPKMSKHLWLYEGVTEYFKELIQMQGGLDNVQKTLKDMKEKIIAAQNYPDSIPFTKMSANVYDKKYKDLYLHVYDRGAVLAMLLDFKIMELTKGKKTLKDVVFELAEEYGSAKSLKEDSLIVAFVNHVHPDLQQFFDDYVTGTKALDLKAGFNTVGIDYNNELKTMVPINIISKKDNGVKTRLFIINNKYTIKRGSEKDIVGFKKGDKVDRNEIFECFKDNKGNFVAEGTIISVPVLRDKKKITLSFPAKYKKGILYNVIKENDNKTPMQQKLFELWTKGGGHNF